MCRLEESDWLERLSTGDESAAAQVFQKYYDRLVELAASYTRGLNLVPGSREDFVMNAFKSFWRKISEHQVEFENESGIWSFLCCLTIRKILIERRKQKTIRGGGNECVLREADMVPISAPKSTFQLADMDSGIPPASVIAEMEEEGNRLLLLYANKPKLREIIELRLDGWTSTEIAGKLGFVPQTINYHLAKIQKRWLFFHSCADIISLKFAGFSDSAVNEATGFPTEWGTLLWRAALALWTDESSVRWNTPEWLQIIESYFTVGKWSDESISGRRKRLHDSKIQHTLPRIAEEWEKRLLNDWRFTLEDIWDDFNAKKRS